MAVFLSLGADPPVAGHLQCQRNYRPTMLARKRDPLRWVMGRSEQILLIYFPSPVCPVIILSYLSVHSTVYLNYFYYHDWIHWVVVWMWIACSIILPCSIFKLSSQTALSPQWLDDLSCLSCLNCKTVSLCVSFHILRASYSVLLS